MPTIFGSPPKARRQSPSLKTTTGGIPGAASSDGRMRASQLRTHAEELKIVSGHQFAPDPLCAAAEPQAQGRRARSGETGERPVALADVLVVGIGQALQPAAARLRHDDTQPPRALNARLAVLARDS